MSERFTGQEVRDNLAEDLTELRNSNKEEPEIGRAEARGYLKAKKETSSIQLRKMSM